MCSGLHGRLAGAGLATVGVVPSVDHEVLVELFRRRPALAGV
jgi:hypothetical protein